MQRRLELWPALTLKARVAAVRRLKAGEGAELRPCLYGGAAPPCWQW